MSDPRLSPINVPISSFPEHVFIAACGLDPLHDEAVALAERLEKGGIKVVLRDIPGAIHGWDKDAKEGTPGGEARSGSYEAAVETLKTVFKSD
jgi:acetyl esterase/lipase